MLRLYDYFDSGNGYKARLALAQLAIPYRLIAVDIEKVNGCSSSSTATSRTSRPLAIGFVTGI